MSGTPEPRFAPDAGAPLAPGVLAAGLLHDLKNLLTLVIGHAEFALDHFPPGSAGRAHVVQAIAAAGQAARLAVELAGGACGKVPQGGVSPDAAVLRAVGAARAILGADVDLRVRVPRPLPRVGMSGAHLEQALLNLLLNARDALPPRGRLWVVGRRGPPEGAPPGRCSIATPWPTPTPPAEVVEISVSDNGTGMSNVVARQVFEPFFTTKGPSGSGLGLAMVRSLVAEAGGRVVLDSSYGEGTTVRLQLPPAGDPVSSSRPARTPGPGGRS